MRICVIGTGYVGLVAGACFADKGYDVTCVDIDERKIGMLNAGKMPIYEPGLKTIVKNARKRNHLTFSTDLEEAVKKALAIFICVGTPEGPDGKPVMKYVYSVAESLAQVYEKYPVPDPEIRVVATKSTVPVGTGTEIENILAQRNVQNVFVASNPEFLKEGDAINDFVKPDRIVIGANEPRATKVLSDLYAPFLRKSERLICMDRASAEMTKFAANSMLALRITFMNQIAGLCEKVGADVTSVRHGLGSDSRIGSSFLFPGPGYGGSCFPKDVKALIELAKANDTAMSIMQAVDTFNQEQKHLLAQKIVRYFGNVKGKIIGIWGLTFKPETDDVRESPSIYIIQDLLSQGASIKAYDPEGTDNFRLIIDDANITYCSSMYDALKGVDAVAVVTDWNEFKMPDFAKMKEHMVQPVVFDGRNLYSQQKMRELGFFYSSLGRADVRP